MTLTFDLLRHGETSMGGFRGSLDDALTEKGWLQMQQAVSDKEGWTHIISSPLQRCRDFAEALSQERGLALSIEPDLRELHFGDWEGRSAADIVEQDEEALSQFWKDPYCFTPPHAEPVRDFSTRVHAVMKRLYQEAAGQQLLIVTHGGVMRLLLAHAWGIPEHRLLQVEVPHAALFRLHMSADDLVEDTPWMPY